MSKVKVPVNSVSDEDLLGADGCLPAVSSRVKGVSSKASSSVQFSAGAQLCSTL